MMDDKIIIRTLLDVMTLLESIELGEYKTIEVNGEWFMISHIKKGNKEEGE